MAPKSYSLSSDDELPSMDAIARRITSKSMQPTAGDVDKENAPPRTLKAKKKADPTAPDSVSKPTPLRRRKLGNPQALDNSLFQKWSDIEPSKREKRVGLASKLRTSRLRAQDQESSEVSLGNISAGISLPESDSDDITFVRRNRTSPRKLSQRLREAKPVAPISFSSSDEDDDDDDDEEEESESEELTEPSGLKTKASEESELEDSTEPSGLQIKASEASESEEATEPSELQTKASEASEDSDESEFVTALSLDTEPDSSSDPDDLPVSRTSKRQSDRQPKKKTPARRSLGGRCHSAIDLEEPKPVPEATPSKGRRKTDQAPKDKADLEDAFKKLQILADDMDDSPIAKPRSKPILRPLTPTKTLAPSPAKGNAIPESPWKPEESEFWDPEVQNKWIDQHSPSKPPSPKKMIIDDQVNTKAAMKLKYGTSPEKRNAKKAFEARKDAIAQEFLAELDERITSGQLAKLAASTGGIRIQWSTTLQSTAGRAHWKCKEKTVTAEQPDGSLRTVQERQHTAHIELAAKVLTNEHDLVNTVAHEFCHLATFMLDGRPRFAHGAEFKAWGRKCVAAFGGRGIDVTTKHNYEIEYKYIWRCADCTTEVHRHSKSVDPARHRCGRCRGLLEQVKPVPRGQGGGAAGKATAAGGAAPGAKKKTAYQEFVGREMKAIKAENKTLPFKDMMALVSTRWKAQQQAAKAAPAPGADAAKGPVPVSEVAEELEELVIEDLST